MVLYGLFNRTPQARAFPKHFLLGRGVYLLGVLSKEDCGEEIMVVTVDEIKSDIEGVLGRLIESDDAAEFEANGKRWQIVAKPKASKLSQLVPRPGLIVGDPEDLVRIDWSENWNADLP